MKLSQFFNYYIHIDRFRVFIKLISTIEINMLQLLSYMAEDERKRIKERQEEGIKIAINNGIKFGRKKYCLMKILRL
jgi:DNA invertase Pin-like site-specific DNA recombinase